MPNHIHGILVLIDSGRGEAFGRERNAKDQHHYPDASPLQPRGTTPGEAFAQNVLLQPKIIARTLRPYNHAVQPQDRLER